MKHKFAKTWDDVTVSQFIELRNIDPELTYTNRQLEILSILDSGFKEADYEDMDVDELDVLLKDLSFLKQEPSHNFRRTIDEFTCIDVNKLTVGEFIDLQYYFKENYIDNLPFICAILYRKTITDKWNNLVFEPYTYSLDERADEYYDAPINDVYGLVKYFLDFKDMFMETYKSLFTPQDAPDEAELNYIPDEEEQKVIAQEELRESFAWESLLLDLADNDLTKIEAVTNLPLVFVFNMLTTKKVLKIGEV